MGLVDSVPDTAGNAALSCKSQHSLFFAQFYLHSSRLLRLLLVPDPNCDSPSSPASKCSAGSLAMPQ